MSVFLRVEGQLEFFCNIKLYVRPLSTLVSVTYFRVKASLITVRCCSCHSGHVSTCFQAEALPHQVFHPTRFHHGCYDGLQSVWFGASCFGGCSSEHLSEVSAEMACAFLLEDVLRHVLQNCREDGRLRVFYVHFGLRLDLESLDSSV